MNTTLTLPAPVLTEKIGVMRPAATGPTFGAWAAIYDAPVVDAPVVSAPVVSAPVVENCTDNSARNYFHLETGTMDFTGLEF